MPNMTLNIESADFSGSTPIYYYIMTTRDEIGALKFATENHGYFSREGVDFVVRFKLGQLLPQTTPRFEVK